jgi:hypothetical protein
MDAALFVDLVNAQLHPIAGLFAKCRDGAGQILNCADQNFILADALLGLRQNACG